jgi:tetratricopeptide (TPR) repeat protein
MVSLPLVLLAMSVPAAAGAAQARPQPVRDLRYGKALYDFYQDQYFRSITDIMVAQARAPITTQGSDPELLLGSLYLSYGMHEAAAAIFDSLLSKRTNPHVHDMAWFYIGRMRYMDGEYVKAIQAFKSIEKALPESLKAERLYLLVNAYLYGNNYGEAIKVLGNIADDGIWNDYTRYNLGIALVRSGRIKAGIDLLGQLSRLTPKDEEEYSLRDKANIALGYASLRNDTSLDPIGYFSSVRLSGPFSRQALLGLGWAYTAHKQQREALKPWMELSSRPTADSTSQEALVAIAYALEQLGQRKLALSYYAKAVSAYDAARAKIDAALSDADYIALLRNNIPSSFASDDEWSNSHIQTGAAPAVEYIHGELISPDFQKAYTDYQDLKYLRIQVEKWRERIPLLHTMLEERRQQYTLNVAHAKDAHYAERIDALYMRRGQLANQVEELEKNKNTAPLETRKERERLKQLHEIKTKLDTLAGHGIDVAAELREYRILYGLTQWRLHTEYPIRLWRVKKGLRELDQALAQDSRERSSLDKILKITPLNFDAFSRRIADLDVYLQKLSGKLESAATSQEQNCNRLIIDALVKKRREVDTRRSRALFAQARLFDQLSHDADPP